jgi:multiple sugar transport system substrate-binding protein
MTNTNRLAATLGAAACLMSGVIATPALADAICSKDVAVLAQPRDGLTILEKYKDEFKALSGASFNIDYLNENDRRAKSRADASTVGKYNVYYIDEANIALFASSKWVVPLLDYYPKDYDYADFDAGRQKTATVDGVVYFAPLTGGTDLMVYRKDLLEKAGITPPKTLDEFIVAVQKLNDPDHGVYGIALRGLRGSGANVWRWMPYFRGLGGQWFEGNKPVFNSDAFVKATQTYLDLFKYSPPGTKTGSWDESTGAFLSGHVALLVESSPLAGWAIDPTMSKVLGKVGYTAPPSPLPGSGYSHGFAIGTKGNKDDAARKCAGLFIAWATSKENEKRRLDEGKFGELNRTSIMTSDEFNQKFGADLGQALVDAAKVTTITFWQDPEWPTLGDHWGIELEELITGTRTDIKGSADELDAFAKTLVAKRSN